MVLGAIAVDCEPHSRLRTLHGEPSGRFNPRLLGFHASRRGDTIAMPRFLAGVWYRRTDLALCANRSCSMGFQSRARHVDCQSVLLLPIR